MIGALDLAYLVYRMKPQRQAPVLSSVEGFSPAESTSAIPPVPLKVEEVKKIPKMPKSPKKPRKKSDLKIEFEHRPEPTPKHVSEQQAFVPAASIEPEPLIFDEKAIPPLREGKQTARRGAGGEAKWLNDPTLENEDLRKSGAELKKGDITLSFVVQEKNEEEETQVMINGTSWRIMLPSPALNMSAMTQVVRVSYGELYVLGRMAHGTVSGEAYIAAAEVERVARLIAGTSDASVVCDIAYFDKDATSKKRMQHTTSIRFERV